MQIIIDNTVTTEEESLLRTTYNFPIIRFNGSSDNKFPRDLVIGNKYDTIFLSRASNIFQIYDNQEEIYSYPTFVRINSDIWDGESEGQVDAKTHSIESFISGNIVTLFSEKYAFTNDYNLSCNNSTLMKSTLDCLYFEQPNSFLLTSISSDVYSLGRFFGRHNRIDNADFFSKKIELKYKIENENHQRNLTNFITGSYIFFRNALYDHNYDYVCHVPVKPGKYNRFQNITDFNIILLVKEYPDLKQLTPTERAQALNGAFALAEGTDVQGKDILLVDDVITTGATCREIVKLLHRNGARKVDIFTVAKTTHRDVEETNKIVCTNCGENIKVVFRNIDGLALLKCDNVNCNNKWRNINDYAYFHVLHYIYGINHNL